MNAPATEQREQRLGRQMAGLMARPMRRVRRVHLVGIGGAGMAGIAEVLLNLGYAVSGSDLKESAAVKRLRGLNAVVHMGHASANVADADVVVISSAVKSDNLEVDAARAGRIPVIRRAEMLAELMRFRYGIAVAGTHGKTTTTSLVANLLADGELDPTFVVGGKVLSAGANARLGDGPYLVAEADESDASFLHLSPMMAVLTNIDADHLEAYGGDFARLKAAFAKFVQQLPFYGLVILCADDPVVRDMMPGLGRPMLSYGIESDADIRARDVRAEGGGSAFQVDFRGKDDSWPVRLNLPGRHNVLNALAAVAVGRELGLGMAVIQRSLAGFQGIGRRCQVLGEIGPAGRRALLVDDYGHHPREIQATLAAMREAYPARRLVVVFQPHRYSRTQELFDDFCSILGTADVLVLLEVYAAGETPIPRADGRTLAQGVRTRGQVNPVFVPDLEELPRTLAGLLEDRDLILTLGAGDIGQAAQRMAEEMQGGGA
jgi:UDP-N-acetylmuramate--alanine ligase